MLFNELTVELICWKQSALTAIQNFSLILIFIPFDLHNRKSFLL